jgi:DNA-binding transcriptional LysR family regulator
LQYFIISNKLICNLNESIATKKMTAYRPNDAITSLNEIKTNLDIALLRTFVAVAELGSIARASEAVNRSQPATSLQIKRLEERIGVRVFKKQGRGLRLSEGGEILLGKARRILTINDDILTSFNTLQLSGSIRLGISQDFNADWLTDILACIAGVNSAIMIEVRAEQSTNLRSLLANNQIDFAVMLGTTETENTINIATVPLTWIGAKNFSNKHTNVIPLITSPPPCELRQMAINSLEKANIPWRLAFSSPSLSCQRSALEAGLGISIRTSIGMGKKLTALGEEQDLPPLTKPNLQLLFMRASNVEEGLANTLQNLLVTMIREKLESIQ